MVYLHTLKLSIQRMSVYRFHFLSRILGDILFLVMWLSVWKTLYATGNSGSVSESQMTLYVLATQFLIGTMNNSNFLFRLQTAVRKGDLAIELIRPYDFLLRNLFEDVGKMIFYLMISGVPVYGLACLALGLHLPLSIMTWAAFLLAAVLGFLIKYLVEFLFGLLSLWFLEIGGMNPLFFFTVQMLAGAVVPLWYFPNWLRVIADWLPFQGMYFLPASILTQVQDGHSMSGILGLQAAWVVILFLLAQAVWRIGTRKVLIQGG